MSVMQWRSTNTNGYNSFNLGNQDAEMPFYTLSLSGVSPNTLSTALFDGAQYITGRFA